MRGLTEIQLDNMMHALGVDPRMKKLRMYRNRYIVDNDESWNDLVEKGFAGKSRSLNMNYYYVTKKGKELISKLTGARSDEE